MTNLDDVLIFVKVAQFESISRAARSLGMPISTVSRRLSVLESKLGVSLLRCTTRRVTLTAHGREHVSQCREYHLISKEDDHVRSIASTLAQLPCSFSSPGCARTLLSSPFSATLRVFSPMQETLAELIANNGINAGAVVSHDDMAMPVDHWETARVLAVRVNEEAIESGDLWATTGGAAEAVGWLRGDLARHGVSLVPGDLVLTGTHLGLHPVRPGDRVAVLEDSREFVACRIA